MLKEACKDFTPAPTTIYGILSRNNLNRLKLPMKTERRKIIKQKAGELVHLDCHYLPKGLIEGSSKRYYLVALIDSCTRVAWAEVVEDIQSLTVIFSVLHMLNLLKLRYGIKIATVLTIMRLSLVVVCMLATSERIPSRVCSKSKRSNTSIRHLTVLRPMGRQSILGGRFKRSC